MAGGVILAAAVYQLTPLKDVCLRNCRSPLDFVIGYWQPASRGALRMGVEHGAWCVGCCWALMAALRLRRDEPGLDGLRRRAISVEKMLPWKAVANEARPSRSRWCLGLAGRPAGAGRRRALSDHAGHGHAMKPTTRTIAEMEGSP